MNTELQSHINSTCCLSDPDAKALLTAANITDEIATTEITKHVNRLKYYEIWDEMDAIYLFAGTSASQQKFNLKNPADTDAAFRLQFNGGWTHSATGAKPNGTNAYANTFYNPATQGFSNTNAHIGIYVVSPATDQNGRLTGVSNATDDEPIYIIPRVWPPADSAFGFGGNTGPTARFTQSDPRGFFQLNRNGLVTKGSKDGIVVATSTQTLASVTSLDFYLGCGRIQGYGNYRYSDKELGYVSLGNGLTDEKARIHNYLVNDLMTKLGR